MLERLEMSPRILQSVPQCARGHIPETDGVTNTGEGPAIGTECQCGRLGPAGFVGGYPWSRPIGGWSCNHRYWPGSGCRGLNVMLVTTSGWSGRWDTALKEWASNNQMPALPPIAKRAPSGEYCTARTVPQPRRILALTGRSFDRDSWVMPGDATTRSRKRLVVRTRDRIFTDRIGQPPQWQTSRIPWAGASPKPGRGQSEGNNRIANWIVPPVGRSGVWAARVG